ncbi:unnamed protein product, partial [Leptidea sinapis]
MASRSKRSRKTKLVPREFVEIESDDDAKIAELEEQVEKTLSKIRNSDEPAQPNLKFDIKVEVEEYHEEYQPNKPTFFIVDMKQAIKYSNRYRIKSIPNQILDIELRNYAGRVVRDNNQYSPNKKFQQVMFQWRNWCDLDNDNRGPPLHYKCYICSKGWWHLRHFQEHMNNHDEYNMKLEIVNRLQCNIVAYLVYRRLFIRSVKSVCWRCGQDILQHEGPQTCPGCSENLECCTALIDHLRICAHYQELKKVKRRFCCHLCAAFYPSETELFEHM